MSDTSKFRHNGVEYGMKDKLAREELVKKLTTPQKAEVGQLLRVTEIDENGCPTAFEFADAPVTGLRWGVVADVILEADVDQIDVTLSTPCKHVRVSLTPYGTAASTGTASYYVYAGNHVAPTAIAATAPHSPNWSTKGLIWSFGNTAFELLNGGVVRITKGAQSSAILIDGWKNGAQYSDGSSLGEGYTACDIDRIETIRLQMWGQFFGAGTRVVVIGGSDL